MKKINAEEKAKIEKLLEGTRNVIIATDKGSAVVGNKILVLNLLANIGKNLKQCGMTEEEALIGLKAGYSHEEKNKMKNKKIDKLIDEIIDKFFEEDEDE